MTTPPLILPFSDIRAKDIPLVGGKGANLGEMSHAGFPIPPGFCLTTAAFQQFMDACPETIELYKLLASITPADVEKVRTVGERVRKTLMSVPIPEVVAAAVRKQWRALGSKHAYAVRSSATAEDLPDASFAGQQDTYLNIIGEDALLDAVQRCWVSLFTDRAILYRAQNDFPHHGVQLSVVVQQMVMSEKSGIMFTADPLTGHRHTVSIDASFGLGEALVSGIVSPDSYRVDKRGFKIIERRIAEKLVAIFPEKGGGTRQATLAPALQSQTVLSDAEITALAKMGHTIETHYGTPQDIEWGMADGKIYLLQSRPITSLYPIDGLKSPDESLHIFFSMGHQQMMTRAMVPLSLSSFPLILPVARAKDSLESPFLRNSGGRLFTDVTLLLRHPILRKVVFGGMAQFDARAPEAFRLAMQRPEFQGAHGIKFSFSALKWVAGIFRQVWIALWRQDYTGFVDGVDRLIAKHLLEMENTLNAHSPGRAKIEAMIVVMSQILHRVQAWIPQFIAGEIAKRLVPRLCRRWADPADAEAISLGLPGNVVNDMNLAVGDLADLARQSPQLCAFFDELGDDSHAWLKKAAMLDGSAPFMAAWDNFLARYGARGPSEIDMSMPRWYEEPMPILQVIAAQLKKGGGSYRAQHQKLAQAREAATTRLLSGAKRGIFGGIRVRILKRLLYTVEHASVLREHHKFLAVRAMRIVKEALKESARQLTNAGKLSQPDDIWFLRWAELLEIWDDPDGKLAAQIPERRAALERYQKLTPPLVITSDGETPIVSYHVADAPPGALLGNPVSPGVVEGTVRVVHDPQTETLNPGEILVAPFTDPGWTPLFINAGGLIMEIGGMMNHGAVVAREYGIPAIVGVRDATKLLQSGQRVRVDGNRGVVELI